MKRPRPGLVELKFAAEGFRPARLRWRGGWRALGLALLAHALLLALLLTGVQWTRRPDVAPIRAYVVMEEELKPSKPVEPKTPRAVPDKRAAEATKRRDEERRKTAETEKKRLEARRRADEEKKQAETRMREDDMQRRQEAEASLKESLAAEEQARVSAARNARVLAQVDHYKELVRQRVTRSWARPPGAAKGLKCTVRVRLAPGGEVLGVAVTRSSGHVAFDRSVEGAVYKSVPLPVPPERELFERFREIEFVFNPEE